MVFSSHLFVFYFLPLALLVYYLLPMRGKHLSLTLFSYVFYGWANPWFVLLMFTSTLIDYVAGLAQAGQLRPAAWKQPVPLLESRGLARPRRHWSNWLLLPFVVRWVRMETPNRTRAQKVALVVSLIANLTMLGFFKYFNFGLDSWNGMVSAAGWEAARWDTLLRITLPLGISFYTFQSMSYAIDVYRGEARAIRHFGDFFCYVAMFPQLVAGPIIRFQDVADQFLVRTHTLEKFARGVAFFAFGMGKKILLANPCGKVADTVFDAGAASTLDAWYGVTAYAFQIYFDFSAYSDMAIGLGLMLGFVFAKNFDSPYKSYSITEFWRWEPSRRGPHLHQPRDHHGPRRALARGILELRDLGCDPRRHARLRADAGQEQHLRTPARADEDRHHLRDRALHLGLLPRQGPARIRELL